MESVSHGPLKGKMFPKNPVLALLQTPYAVVFSLASDFSVCLHTKSIIYLAFIRE